MSVELQSVAEQLASLAESARAGEITDAFVIYRMNDGSFNYCFNTSDTLSMLAAAAKALELAVDGADMEPTNTQPARLH